MHRGDADAPVAVGVQGGGTASTSRALKAVQSSRSNATLIVVHDKATTGIEPV